MRQRFEQQLTIGQIPIGEVKITLKCRDSIVELLAALQHIFVHPEYNKKIFNVLELSIIGKKKSTGRMGMDLWQIFVLAQVRLCMDLSYDRLHYLANSDKLLRSIMGIERVSGYGQIELDYQNIYDNVNLLDDKTLSELNQIIVSFGHEVFKKKEGEVLGLKTDSFVVESNVHFPTDYNLMWDSMRKSLDIIEDFVDKYNFLTGWRKMSNWYYELKGLMRELGKANSSSGVNKDKRVKAAATKYLDKARLLVKKIEKEVPELPLIDELDLSLLLALEAFTELTKKHIDLLHRRIILGEKIPHQEKIFSIFEQYTEWIKKGKLSPSVELGKKLAITTDQFNLIVDYHIMENEQDRDIVISLTDRVLNKWKVQSWSFDKGFWNKENKELLQLVVPEVIMPKLGKCNRIEHAQENSPRFKRLKNKHSAIESNINELENRGLDRCPDRGYNHFKRYIGIGVCAYNLKKIGRELLAQKREAQKLDNLKERQDYLKAA